MIKKYEKMTRKFTKIDRVTNLDIRRQFHNCNLIVRYMLKGN